MDMRIRVYTRTNACTRQRTHTRKNARTPASRLRPAQVQRRKLEAEVSRLKASLMKSGELLTNKERLVGPSVGMSQLYRSPDTTHLIGNLKDENRKLQRARDELADEVLSLQRSVKVRRGRVWRGGMRVAPGREGGAAVRDDLVDDVMALQRTVMMLNGVGSVHLIL
eukprot:282378-Chlamydomonas_euryale.AAC.1